MKIRDLVETINESKELLRALSIYTDEHKGRDDMDIGDLYSLIDVKQNLKELISIIEGSEIEM